jgi:hypothetical protein
VTNNLADFRGHLSGFLVADFPPGTDFSGTFHRIHLAFQQAIEEPLGVRADILKYVRTFSTTRPIHPYTTVCAMYVIQYSTICIVKEKDVVNFTFLSVSWSVHPFGS